MSVSKKLFPLVAAVSLSAVAVCIAGPVAAQVVDSPIGQIHRHVKSMQPFTGPHGTEISIWTDGLQPNTNYHLAFGEMQGCGYQICDPTRTNARGELAATLVVPDWAHTQHFEVVLIMDESFTPMAVSDPFHVTDAEGLVQREGKIGEAWPGCASLETEDGVSYALVGPRARTLTASEGQWMRVEGRIVEGVCTKQYAIEVVSLELLESGR
jgi:hypothetical protein